MSTPTKPAEKQAQAEDITDSEEKELRYQTAVEIFNSPSQAERRRRSHGLRAAAILHGTEALAPPSQQWLFFLVVIHALGDFENPVYAFSFLHALPLFIFPGAGMKALYLSLAFLDRYWDANRQQGDTGLSIRYFTIASGLWALDTELAVLCRRYINIAAWNWMMLPLVLGMVLPHVPRSLFMFEQLVSINAFVPEGKRGVATAVLFRVCQTLFPEYLHWLLYLRMSFPQMVLDWRLAEWVCCTLWWWYLDVPIDVAYGICLMNNQFIHANTTMRAWGGFSSTVLQRERLGTILFAATCLVLRVAQWSLGFQFRVNVEFQNPPWYVVLFWFIVFGSAIVFFTAEARNDKSYNGSKFQHRQLELQHGRNAIRLLRLRSKPSFGDGQIVCDLIHTSLEFAPPYTAISYTWGTPASYEVIQIDGRAYRVSPNVYSILNGKRSANHNVMLWIDSICINQEDGQEKSTQVALMRRIFEEAPSTIAWIGDADPTDAKLTIDLLRKYNAEEGIPQLENGFSSQELREWNAFLEMMASPWFERSWILQEIAVATQPVLRYGSEEIPWAVFAGAITKISLTGTRHIFLYLHPLQKSGQLNSCGFENAIIMENLRLACMNGDYLSLKDLLKASLMFKATLPIDKVYALLGIVAERGTTHPDHSRTGAKKTKGDIVIDAMNDIINSLEAPMRLFELISGQTKNATRRTVNTLRLPGVAMKETYQFANNLYAWLEKVSPEGEEDALLYLVPDYTGGHTSEGAYTMVAQDLVRKKDTFCFLHHAGIGRPRKLKELPSWVPDWSTNPVMASLPQANYQPPHLGVEFAYENGKLDGLGNRGKERPATKEEWLEEGKKNAGEWATRRKNAIPEVLDEVLEEGGKILRVKGILIDTISELMDLSHSKENLPPDVEGKARAIYESRLNKYAEAEAKVHAYPHFPYGSSPAAINDAFWRTVIADSNPDGTQPASKDCIAQKIRWIKGIEPMYDIASAIAALDSGLELTPEIREKIKGLHEAYLFRIQLQESAEVQLAHLLRNEIWPSFKMYRWETPASMVEKFEGWGMEKKYIFDEKERFGLGIFQDCVDFTAGRLLAVCGEGWLGLVPEGTKKGDRVVQVKVRGGRKCFVLRGASENEEVIAGDGIWDLVGEGFFYKLTLVSGKAEGKDDGKDISKDDLKAERGPESSFKLR